MHLNHYVIQFLFGIVLRNLELNRMKWLFDNAITQEKYLLTLKNHDYKSN